ncbi:hypothetical protein CANINC_000070 [Pichia inconspicua]|uniref:Protein STU1 n=1 Tax=Pichia inconspicua TaxID=52247 RepID=A0A4T0X7D7_9ASCO|nr:hypothetical protein CANINC_000070 [[Candida] inconspicua]
MYSEGISDGLAMLEAVQARDPQRCEETITAFKQYIKRNLVDLRYISEYLQALINIFPYKELSVLAFSTFCHLIKRISIQDTHALHEVYDIVLPFLLQRLGEKKESMRVTAVKSLKTCIESSPNGEIDLIIHYLIRDGINKEQPQIQIPVLDFLYQIIESSENFTFSFKFILDNIIKLLNSQNREVLEKCSRILILYFTIINPTNNTAKNDLLQAILTHHIDPQIASKVLSVIDRNILNRYNEKINASSGQHTPNQHQNSLQSQSDINGRLESLLQKVPNWNVDDVLPKSNFNVMDDPTYESLYNEFMTQQILNEELYLANIDNFVDFIKSLKEPITKGMLSLRTTLSNNSCQLCKELAISIGLYLDATFVDYQLNTLIKLTAARKMIQHQNSNVAIIAFILSTPLNNKFFHLFATTIHDKNIQPRVYTGNWIQFMLLKYYNPSDLDSFHYIVESCEPIIIKGLSDPIPLEAMRNAFWTLTELEPDYETKIMRKLDSQTVKALERSKSSFVNIQVKRTPIKQLINETLKKDPIQKMQSLSYEPVRKIQRSESVDATRLNESVSAIPELKPSVRHHTIDSASHTKFIASATSPITKFEKEDDFDDFTGRIKRENVIYEELSSDNRQLQEAGLKKLLELDESSITTKFNHALNHLSMINPEVLYPIFDDALHFHKISNCISTENTVRLLCFYLIETSDFDKIELILTELSLEDLCLSIINTLNLAIDTSKIDNINLSIQFIKHRVEIISCVLQIFMRLVIFKGGHIKSYMLSSIFECLIKSYTIIDLTDEIKKVYTEVFKLCHVEYKDLLERSIKEISEHTVKKSICDLIGIELDEEGNDDDRSVGAETQRFLSPIKVRQDEMDEDVDQMTKIIPRMKREELGENPFVSDMTMLIPKRKGNGIFDFDNIELRPAEGIEVGAESEEEEEEEDHVVEGGEFNGKKEDEEEEEKEKKKENEPKLQSEPEPEVVDEGTDISMIDKDKSLTDVSMEKNEIEDVQEQPVQEQEESDRTYGDIQSDSTPDLNMLTIDEVEIEEDIGGYIGILRDDLLNHDSITPKNLNEIESVEELAYIVQHFGDYENEEVYSSMMVNIERGKFIEYSLCIIRLIDNVCKVDEKVIEVLSSSIEYSMSIFCCIEEFICGLPLKFILGLKDMNKMNIKVQECILQNILKHLRDAEIDVEDVFMIDRIAKRYNDNDEEIILKMLSFDICKEMYLLHKEGIKDEKGVELVDEWVINNFNQIVTTYCGM